MSAVTRLRRLAGRIGREAALYPGLVRGRGITPRIAFLPSDSRVQSSLLRAYNIADELEKRGWATLVVPQQLTLAQRRRVLSAFGPGLIVMQQCRHPLNRVGLLPDCPLVLDIDDADFLDPGLTEILAQTARASVGVICGSRYIRDWAAQFSDNARVIWTTTPIRERAYPDAGRREPIVTWAQSSPLGYPAELDFVAEVMTGVARRRGPTRFRLYGWDAGPEHPVLDRLRETGLQVELLPFMGYDDFIDSLATVAVGLSPIIPEGFSKGKSFGKILAYLDAGVPVICSDEVDHALFFTRDSGVVSNAPGVWVDQICRLLADPGARTTMANAAHADYLRRLSTARGGELVLEFLDGLVRNPRAGPPDRMTRSQPAGPAPADASSQSALAEQTSQGRG